MKNFILTTILFAAFASACTVNMGTPADSGVSNYNSSTGNNPTTVKTEKSTAADAAKNTENTPKITDEPTSSGQKTERVEFAAGKTETSMTRDIPADGSIDFVLNSRSEQRMQYSVIYDNGSDTDLVVFLTEPSSQNIAKTSAANENNEFIIKKNGDHRITVQNKTGNKVTAQFGLSIK